jgi:hypothetical protein
MAIANVTANNTPHADTRGATVSIESSDGARAGGRGRYYARLRALISISVALRMTAQEALSSQGI